jgi:two-component system sensor kinase FixL
MHANVDAAARPPPRAELELRALLDAAVDAVVVIDHVGRIETFNPAAERLFGYSAAEVLGQPVNLLMPEPHRTRHGQYLEDYARTGHARVIGVGREVFAQRRDGTVFPVLLSVGEVRGARPPRYVGFVHDIGERHAAVEALQKSEALLSSAQAIANLGNFEVRAPGGSVHWSAQLYAIIGRNPALGPLSPREFVEQVVHPDDRAAFKRAWQQAAAGSGRFELEYRIVRPDGSLRDLHSLAQIVPGAGPGTTQIAGTLHDVTDRKLALAEMRQSQERLTHVGRLSTMGEMATGLAHEINQPLTAIATYAQAAVRMMDAPHGADRGELRDALVQITAQALRAGEVIRRLRAFVKNRAAQTESVDLNRLIQDLRVLAEPDARINDVRLTLQLDPRVQRVSADPVQIQQVLLNLVRNAIDATLEAATAEREIVISTRTLPQEVEVAVIDHGGGIPQAVAAQLFNPFFTTKAEGTGLGLAISRSIIRAHRGKLSHRPTPGGGTTFLFTLPPLSGG